MKTPPSGNLIWIGAALVVSLVSACDKASYDRPPEPLYLTSLQPEDSSRDVPDGAIVEGRFSRAPDPATVTADTFRLLDETSDEVIPARIERVEEAPGRPVTLYRLVPSDLLEPGSRSYRIEVSDTIATADGALLDLPWSMSLYPVIVPARFLTAEEMIEEDPDIAPPRFYTYVIQATAIGPTSIEFAWYPALDDRTPWQEMTYEIFCEEAGVPIDPERPQMETAPGAFSYAVGGLSPDTTYTIMVRALDAARNPSVWNDSHGVSFRTAVAGDTTELTLLYTADVFGTLEPCG